MTDSQKHVDIGFQREGYAGGVLGNLQPERVKSEEEHRNVNRPPLEGNRLPGRERVAACPRGLSFRLHFRSERTLDDDACIQDSYRYEVGAGSKRRVGAGGDDNPFIARAVPVAVIRDNPPVLKLNVLSKTDIQSQVGIGFQREGYAGSVLGNLQLI